MKEALEKGEPRVPSPFPLPRGRGKSTYPARLASQPWIAGGTSRCARPDT
jgi:hypothetical protein